MHKNIKKRLGLSLLCAALTLTQLPAAVMAGEGNSVNEETTVFTDGEEEANGNISVQTGGGYFLKMRLLCHRVLECQNQRIR